MSDIDLIPSAYRTSRWQSRWIKYSAFLLVGLAGIFIAGSSVLGVATGNIETRVEALQHRQSITTQQLADIEQLGVEKTELMRQLHLLSDLRSGAAAGDMFVTIDRALTRDDVWFLDWKFQRAGVVVADKAEVVSNGYFIVAPDGGQPLAADKLRIQTLMEIRGQARDHSALSGFVRRLFAQPGIDDIRIQRTSLIRRDQADTVDFELSVVLNTDVRRE